MGLTGQCLVDFATAGICPALIGQPCKRGGCAFQPLIGRGDGCGQPRQGRLGLGLGLGGAAQLFKLVVQHQPGQILQLL
jgi:hypothetical protein